MSTGMIGRLRRPEYTGENRCVPCTAANLAIGAALAVAVAFLLPRGVGPATGVAVFVVAAVAIYFRGYLVPGTPRFTRTYFPDWLLRAFDKHPTAGPVPGGNDEEVDVESALVEVGALTECDDVDDLCLTAGFREDWLAAVETLRREDPHPRDMVTGLGAGVRLGDHGGPPAATDGDVLVGQWPSEAALLADAAASEALSARYPGWEGLGPRARVAVLTGLRLFVERCPSCDGTVTIGEEAVQSCCRWVDVVAVTCDDCGARLVEVEAPEAD